MRKKARIVSIVSTCRRKPQQRGTKVNIKRRGVILGVRPEDILVAGRSKGDLTLIAAWAGKHLAVAEGDRNFRQALDTPIDLYVDPERVCLLDGTTGGRV